MRYPWSCCCCANQIDLAKLKTCSSFPSLVTVMVAGGAGLAASRKCSICAPLIWGSTTTFQRRKFVLVSFSDGGGRREGELLWVDDDAKVEDADRVDKVLMVDAGMVDAAVDGAVPDMI